MSLPQFNKRTFKRYSRSLKSRIPGSYTMLRAASERPWQGKSIPDAETHPNAGPGFYEHQGLMASWRAAPFSSGRYLGITLVGDAPETARVGRSHHRRQSVKVNAASDA
jgi:hypothetical protein